MCSPFLNNKEEIIKNKVGVLRTDINNGYLRIVTGVSHPHNDRLIYIGVSLRASAWQSVLIKECFSSQK